MQRVDAEPSPRWLVQDFLADDALTMLSGHPKKYGRKSLLAMTQALCLASGKGFCAFKPLHQIPVLYLYCEGARKPTSMRFHKLMRGLELEPKDIRDFFIAHRTPIDLRDKSQVRTIGRFCREHEVKLVVFDTLAKSMGGDEDDAENVGKMIRGIEEARSFGISVMILHHLAKNSVSLVHGSFDPDRDMRGSSALAGAYETHQAVRHYGYNEHRADLLVQNKDGAEFAHKHWWDFDDAALPNGEPDPERGSIKLHMGPRIPWEDIGILDTEEIAALTSPLKLGTSYPLDMLASVWKVSKAVAQDLCAKLISQEELEAAKFNYKLCGS